jgi:hypothetical protein
MRAGWVTMALVIAGGTAAPALAANDMDAMVNCATVAADNDRLACYDTAVSNVSAKARAAAASRAAAATEAEKVRAAEEAKAAQIRAADEAKATKAAQVQAFGGAGLKSVPKPAGIVDSVTETVTAASLNGERLWVVVLENNMVWRQTSGDGLPTLNSGDVVTIKKGAMGGYRLVSPRWKTLQMNVMRVR